MPWMPSAGGVLCWECPLLEVSFAGAVLGSVCLLVGMCSAGGILYEEVLCPRYPLLGVCSSRNVLCWGIHCGRLYSARDDHCSGCSSLEVSSAGVSFPEAVLCYLMPWRHQHCKSGVV